MISLSIIEPLWQTFWSLRLFFIVLDAMLAVIFIYGLIRSMEVRPNFHGDWRPKKRVLTLRQAVFGERWEVILKKFLTGSPEAVRVAILEADALVDDVLKQMGLEGNHMADRLSQFTLEDAPTLPRIWKAHRLRNDIVHQPGFAFTADEGRLALEDFEAFLKDIGAL